MKVVRKSVGLLIKLIRTIVSFSFTLVIIGIGLLIYARYIEPELLIVKTEKIVSTQYRNTKNELKIVQFSDLHLGTEYSINDLERVVEKINALDPDLVIFTGDLIDNNKFFDEVDQVIEVLSKINAKVGKYAVFGNHDHGGNGTRRYTKIMKQADFKLLRNESDRIEVGKGQFFNIMGIDDIVLGKVDYEQTLKNIDSKDYNLFLSHAPDVADKVLKYPIDLQLSGHTHGGQVSLPIIGAPLTPPYGRKYVKGRYTFEDNKRLTLYVNPGIGTSQKPFRLGNVPEVTLFLLSASPENK